MTITLQPEQEQAIVAAIRRGAFGSVSEFIDAAIATLPGDSTRSGTPAPRKARLWELRQGLSLDDLSIKSLIEEGRE